LSLRAKSKKPGLQRDRVLPGSALAAFMWKILDPPAPASWFDLSIKSAHEKLYGKQPRLAARLR
jgi:hypothetical protein